MQTSRSKPMRNPFEVPVTKNPEIPEAQKVEATLAKIQAAENGMPREDALALAARVFEHSSEDGMKMAERLKLTPQELLDACARGSYALKHPKIFNQLLDFVRRNKKDLPGELKRLELAEKTATDTGTAQALKFATPQAKKLYADIDAAYADLLKERKIKSKHPAETGETTPEQLAENFLARIDLALQGGYYAGPVQGAIEKKLDAKQLRSKAWKDWADTMRMASVVTTAELENACRDFSLDAAAIQQELRKDKYVLYGDLVKYEKSAARTALKKEIEEELEEGERLELNQETNRYEIVEGENGKKEKESGRREIPCEGVKDIGDIIEIGGQIYYKAKDHNDDDVVVCEDGTHRQGGNPVKLHGRLYWDTGMGAYVDGKGHEIRYDNHPWSHMVTKTRVLKHAVVGDKLHVAFMDIIKGGMQENHAIEDEDGNISAKQYYSFCDLAEVNGKLMFAARELNGPSQQMVIADETGTVIRGFEYINSLTSLDGKIYFTASKSQFSRNDPNNSGVFNEDGECIIPRSENQSIYHVVNVKGRLFYSGGNYLTESKGKYISPKPYIKDQDGNVYGEDYEEVGKPYEVDGKLAYRAKKDGKWIIVVEEVGKPKKQRIKEVAVGEYELFEDCGLTALDGNLYLNAIKDKKLEIIDQNGKCISAGYDGASSPTVINGKLFFIASQDNKQYLVDKEGNRYGKGYERIDNTTMVRGKLFFEAYAGGQLTIIDQDGNEYGTKYKNPQKPIEINGKLYYQAIINDKKTVVIDEDGNFYGEEYENASLPMDSNGKLHFMAEKGGKVFITDEDGLRYGDEYEEGFSSGININGKNYLLAPHLEGEIFLIDANGERSGVEYNAFSPPVKINNDWYFRKYENGINIIRDQNGKRYGEGHDIVGDPSNFEGKLAYLVKKDGKLVIVIEDVELSKRKPIEDQLDILNLVHDPDEEGVKKFFEEREKSEEEKAKKARSLVEQSHEVAYMLNRLIREVPDAFLATVGARRDRASDILAKKIISKAFPEVFKREQNMRGEGGWFGFLGGGNEKSSAANPEDYLSANETDGFEGGGRELMDDSREVMEFREPITGLVVTGLYGKHLGDGRWSKSYIPLRRKPLGISRETTVTLPHVRKGQDIVLPKPLDSAILPERVRGIKKNGAEVELKAEEDSLGMSKVEDLPAVEKVAYSLNFSEGSEPMAPVSVEEYNNFRTRLTKTYGNDMAVSLAALPEEVDAFLTSDRFTRLAPRERVMAIERFVRSSGYYDFDNHEVSKHKRGKSIEDKMMISEMRIEELRSKNPNDPRLKGKQWAGVCADFGWITCAILRRAGFICGVARGFALHNEKTATMKSAHGTAFVVWPDGLGGMRAVSVDGTPDGIEGVSLPDLEERVKAAESEMESMLEDSREQLDEILKTINSGDADAIRQLENGKLENVLNVILTHGVKKSHAGMIQEMLNFYWYGGLEKMEDVAQGVELRKTMEDYLINRRERQASGDAQNPAGTELFNTVEQFASRFQKSAGKDYAAALDKLDAVTRLAKEELDPMELRAMTAVVTYLRGKNMAGGTKNK